MWTWVENLIILTGLLWMSMVAVVWAEGPTHKNLPVVELFTSQGCSSCPPADHLLNELAGRGDVLALTLPVDYWDYLGWKDTLASPVNTDRQRAYAQFFGLRSIYTPQMIIDGTHQLVGSRRDEVLRVVEERKKIPYAAAVALERDGGVLDVVVTGSSVPVESTVWLVQIDARETVPIQRGENGGKTITYLNVVRDISPIGMWHGTQSQFRLPLKDILAAGRDGCAILVQQSDTGQIIGAAYFDVNS